MVISKRRKNKFNSKTYDAYDITFDSTLEARFYLFLKSLPYITDIKTQIPIPLDPDDLRLGYYICDFSFFDTRTEKTRLVEIKTIITVNEPVFRLKMKMLGKQKIDIEILIASYKDITGKSFKDSQFVYKLTSIDAYYGKRKVANFNNEYYTFTLSKEYLATKSRSKT